MCGSAARYSGNGGKRSQAPSPGRPSFRLRPSGYGAQVETPAFGGLLRMGWFAITRQLNILYLLNQDSGLRPDPFQQPPQPRRREGDAAGGRPKTGPGHVDENRAAASGDPRPGIVVDLHDIIVEAVVAPKPVAGRLAGKPEGLIIPPVGRVLAPGGLAGDRAHRQPRARPRGA